MTKQIVAEYIWYDVFGSLRSKTKNFTKNFERNIQLSDFTEWNFDGSSTGHSDGSKSDIIIRPVSFYKDPFRRKWENCECFLVLCDIWKNDGITPHEANNRIKTIEICNLTSSFEPWFGLEQEYIIYQLGDDITSPIKPYGWITEKIPNYRFQVQNLQDQDSSTICSSEYKPYSSTPFYCSNGGDRTYGRSIVEKHYEYCIYSGIGICGINAEVTCSQWEMQIFAKSGYEVCDQLWIARYILNRIAEEFHAFIEYGVKPVQGWNGSGCHTNFSTNEMRQDGGYDKIIEACEKMALVHKEHIEEYGDESNKLRLTGLNETSSYEKFTYGHLDRGVSIRIPYTSYIAKKGYLEDRRPASNCDPYKVVSRILKTVCLN